VKIRTRPHEQAVFLPKGCALFSNLEAHFPSSKRLARRYQTLRSKALGGQRDSPSRAARGDRVHRPRRVAGPLRANLEGRR
jgi:hypothetical protein